MLPGQLGLLLLGIISVLALAGLGVFSYLNFAEEKRQKEKQARVRRREQWHESLKASADDDLSEIFAEEEVTYKPAQEAEELIEDFEPFALPDNELEADKPTPAPKPAPASPKPVVPKTPEKRGSTRNDFNFKF